MKNWEDTTLTMEPRGDGSNVRRVLRQQPGWGTYGPGGLDFIVSAEKKEGKVIKVRIFPEKGRTLLLEDPFKDEGITFTGTMEYERDSSRRLIRLKTRQGEEVILRRSPASLQAS